MRRVIFEEIACRRCHRKDRKYHAKGLCKACYMANFRQKAAKEVTVFKH